MLRKLSIVLLCFTSTCITRAQDNNTNTQDTLTEAQKITVEIASKKDLPDVLYTPPVKPQYWARGIYNRISFSHVSLTNWAQGGNGSVAMSAYSDASLIYKRDNMEWENHATLAYGFVQSFGDIYKKNDDKLIIDSKWGYTVANKLNLSAAYNFRTQFSKGYSYSGDDQTFVSNFLSPGYMTLGLGIDYKPAKTLSINFSPLTGSINIINNKGLRTKYGNSEDQRIKTGFGALLNLSYVETFANFKINTKMSLFSDYLDNPQNLRVVWDLSAEYAINKFFSISLITNFLYDDRIMIANDDGIEAPRVQFKENFGFSFTYTLGQYKKK